MPARFVVSATGKVHKAFSVLAGIVAKASIEQMRRRARCFSVTIRKRDRRA